MEAVNTNVKVIGLTRLGIKPESTAQETDGHLSCSNNTIYTVASATEEVWAIFYA